MCMRFHFTFLGLLLIASIMLQFGFHKPETNFAVTINLENKIPQNLAGWDSEDLPLGANEIIEAAANRQLVLDDFIIRRYSRGQVELTVYIGYWAEGKMDTRFVASHTPDRCWTKNGWICIEQEYNEPIILIDETTKPSQYRIFEINQQPVYVYYWHLVGNDVYDYGERFNNIPDPAKYVRDFIRQLKDGTPEQYFIRINSNVPFTGLFENSSLKPLWQDLLSIGLAAQPAES